MRTKTPRKNRDHRESHQERLSLHSKPSDGIRKAAISEVKKTITSRLKSEHASLKKEVELMAVANAPVRSLLAQHPKAVAANVELKKMFGAEQKSRLKAFQERLVPITTLDLQVNPGFDIIAPPYDLEWHLAFSQADKKTGVFTVNDVIGYEAAGVGVILSSPVRAAISFRPIVSYKYLWANSPAQAPSSTRGGLGILVYRNNETQPFLDMQRVLWYDWRDYPSPGAMGEGDGYFAQEFAPSVLLQVEAGDNFRIWMWCWSTVQFVHTSDKFSLASGHIECQMLFIVVDTGPPLPPIG